MGARGGVRRVGLDTSSARRRFCRKFSFGAPLGYDLLLR